MHCLSARNGNSLGPTYLMGPLTVGDFRMLLIAPRRVTYAVRSAPRHYCLMTVYNAHLGDINSQQLISTAARYAMTMVGWRWAVPLLAVLLLAFSAQMRA